eukprot:gnl/MRDRNA2_/MRDRNA2_92984_c0_seq1.p1 gnl/MRDRNA2_/MRDRNA2_92984_c0~~gnl/MRDRNA2_/MRDRNA2_92984_c0_seq1.p1  ORF type:complete len:307 (+),score=46.08 gnl/MRDRNA2_/MRDRNA2_92984_c0_seq1:103-921(+)
MTVPVDMPSFFLCIVNLVMLYSTAQVFQHWEIFAQCRYPLHLWLMALYVSICSFQIVFHVGGRSVAKTPGDEGVAWYMCRPTVAAQSAFIAIVVVLLPFLAIWAIVGAGWFAANLEETPNCFPTDAHPSVTFFISCIAASLVLTPVCSMYALHAWCLGGSLKRATASLKAIQDADMLHRWGEPAPLFDVDLQGMSTDCIAALPTEEVGARNRRGSGNCPICLSAFVPGEKMRRLPGCEHCFHRACVDLWLVRNKNCPMCKKTVCMESDCEQV